MALDAHKANVAAPRNQAISVVFPRGLSMDFLAIDE